MRNTTRDDGSRERGTILIVCLVLVVGLVGLSSAYLTRTLYESRRSSVQEDSLEALFNAYGMLARAEAIMNRSDYDTDTGRNVALIAALAADDKQIGDTSVTVTPVGDPSDTIFFNLLAESTVGPVTRKVRVLVREKESFADYNYFVNIHPLGIAGRPTPRGSIHSNRNIDFYFPDGRFVDAVTASEGFYFKVGASRDNTTFDGPHSENAEKIPDLTNIDIPALSAKAVHKIEDPDLDARIYLRGDEVLVEKWTRAGYYEVPKFVTRYYEVGQEDITITWNEPIYRTDTWTEIESIYEWQDYTYTEEVPIYETETYTYNVTEPIYEEQTVEKTREVPVYAYQTVTLYRTEDVWVDDDPDAIGGGTAIAGSPTGLPGHWETVEVPYEEEQQYISHYETETYTVTETVQVGENVVENTGTREVQVGTETVERVGTQKVKIGEEEVTKTQEVIDHYEEMSRIETQPIIATVREVDGTRTVWQSARNVGSETIPADGLIYIAGNVTKLEGNLDGRVTVATNGRIFITGSLVYVDGEGDSAYLNGDDHNQPYEPNDSYDGTSVLGVIANREILYTQDVPNDFELNGSFLSRSGRVGITGIVLDAEGDASLAH